MTPTDQLAKGREAYAGRRWKEAFEHLAAADLESPLEPDDLQRLADAAFLIGEPAWQGALMRAHTLLRDRGELTQAVRSLFWLVLGYFNSGEVAHASGWLGRAHMLVDEIGDCAESGFLILPPAIEGCDREPDESMAAFRRAQEIGEHFRDADLIAMARHGEARCHIRLGDPAKGMAVLDGVLVSLMTKELSPIVEGVTYCGALEACRESFDVRRAVEWTTALSNWCDSQPDLVAFRGECLIYRSSVMQIHGAWGDALDDVERACTRLMSPVVRPALGAAFYQRAELQRLSGAFAESAESYSLAGERGHDPQPGLALLRLAQGDIEAARASARRALDERTDRVARSSVLAATVEIALAANDLPLSRRASDELTDIATAFMAPFLLAQASHAEGSVLLAEGKHGEALAPLRQAGATFAQLDAPYDAARTRVLIGAACLELGDRDGADIEWLAARHAFERLGASPELDRLAKISGGERASTMGLTARELDILRLVAKGRTNPAIGDELVISEKTVARHVSNIFNKVGVSSRAAATAFAYEHGLLSRPG